MITITDAKYKSNYTIELTFSNGETGSVDLEDTIKNDYRQIFQPLRNIDFFKSFKLELDTVVWENEADFAPEFLFYKTFKDNSVYQDLFKKWGYIS